MIPTGLAIVFVNVVLLGAGLVLFWPGSTPWPRKREAARLAAKYGVLVLAAALTLVFHLLLVQADAGITEALGTEEEWTARVVDLEDGFVPGLARFHSALLDVLFSVVYLVVHPFVIYFSVVLFLLTDDERSARAALLAFPLAYALALPFYLFLPVTNVYIAGGLPTPVFEVFPGLAEFYYRATTQNNTFPSLHVGLALLLWNAARYSRNRFWRVAVSLYAPAVVVGTLYLQIHYAIDVIGGVAVALIAGGLIHRATKPERLALRRVKPEPEEAHEIQGRAERLVARTEDSLRRLGYEAKAELVGSIAKDTYLRDKVDYDVFVLFDPTLPRPELERRGLAIGRDVLPGGEAKYAEHPYIRGAFEQAAADIVPAYAVASPDARMTAVDRTPFHTAYVLRKMSREARDEVRLLKQFCRGIGVYGAEARTRGFSGYLCELLILKYGDFRAVLRAATGWRPGTFLTLETLEGHPRFPDPLVVLDPVDPKRNAASAVAEESLRRFVEAARAYESRAGLPFFFPRQLVPLHPDEVARIVARRRTAFLLLSAERPDVLEDHLHDQMRKAARGVEALLARHDFDVVRVSYAIEPRLFLLVEVARRELPIEVVHPGPPLAAREHAERFRKAWAGNPAAISPVYEERGRLYVRRRREFRRADELVRAKFGALDAGKHVGQAFRESLAISVGLDAVSEESAGLFTRHLDTRPPWER